MARQTKLCVSSQNAACSNWYSACSKRAAHSPLDAIPSQRSTSWAEAPIGWMRVRPSEWAGSASSLDQAANRARRYGNESVGPLLRRKEAASRRVENALFTARSTPSVDERSADSAATGAGAA